MMKRSMILFCLLVLLLKWLPAQVPKITGYEYWFDDNYSSHVSQSLTPAVSVDVTTSFPAASLSAGIHRVYVRFKDDSPKKSIPSSFLFYKSPVSQAVNGMISGYEYWFDQNYGAKVSVSTGNISSMDLNSVFNATALPGGLHTLNFRVKGASGSSLVTSNLVYKSELAVAGENLTAYEYWFDDNYAGKVVTALGNVSETNIFVNFNSGGLSEGLHTLRFRARGTSKSSMVTSYLFYKSVSDILVRNLATLEFWFDDDPGTMDTLQIQPNVPFLALLDTLKTTYLPIGLHRVNYRFRDSRLLHSSAITDEFQLTSCTPYPAGAITGSTVIQKGQTGVVFSIPKIKNALGYSWTLPAGASIVSGGNTRSVTVNFTCDAVSGNIGVHGVNPCGSSASATLPVTVQPLQPPSLAGTATVCQGTSGWVYTTESGKTNYTWSVSPGNTITAGGTSSSPTATVQWNSTGSQWIRVNYTSVYGCRSLTDTQYNVFVNPSPVPAITGNSSVCVGSAGKIYSTQTGMTGYAWTVSAGGTITAGAGTSAITVTWSTSGAKTVSVNYTNANGCTAAAPLGYGVTVNPLPVPTVSGPASACISSTGNTYSTQSGMTGYLWTVSAGGTITAGSGTNTITVAWNSLGAKTVTVNYTNATSCTASAATVYNVTVNALPTPSVSGPSSVCAGSTAKVYSTQAGMTGYLWTVSPGGTITSGAGTSAITVTWNAAGAQTVSVNYNNANGCSAAIPAGYNVTVNPLPVPAISGPASICVTSTGKVYSTQPGMTGYLWTVSAGGVVTAGAGTNAITVTWNTSGVKTVSVNYTNENSCSATTPSVYGVTVNPLPVPAISGPSSVCPGSTGNVYATQSGMTGYSWTVSGGGTVTGGAGTDAITVTWNTSGAQTVSVYYTNANGCSAATSTVYYVTVNPLPVPTVSGSTVVCVASSGNVYTTQPGMTGYIWTISAGGIITAGTGTNAITVTWNSAGPQTISIKYIVTSGCTDFPATVVPVMVNPIPGLPSLSGPSTVCEGTIKTYTTDAGKTNYSWVVTGGSIYSGAGTFKIGVRWNSSGTGSIGVNYTNTFGCYAAAPALLNVNVNPLPAPVIAGSSNGCINSTGNVYTTDAEQETYIWSVSPGGTVTSGGTINDDFVMVTWNSLGTQSVSVNYPNAFGCFAVTGTVLPVTVSPVPFPTLAGNTTVCAQSSGNVYTTEAAMSAYLWTVSSGGTIVGSATGSSLSVTWNSSGSQWVGVNYSNANGCPANTPALLNVTVSPLPATPGSIAGPVQVMPAQTGVGYSVSPIVNATGYLWTLPSGATIVSGSNTSNIVVDFSLNAVSGGVSVHGTNACGNGGESQILGVQVIPASVALENVSLGSGQINCDGAAQTIFVAGNGTAFTVQSGGSATMIAGHNILYRPSVSVASGGYMHGYITTNSQYCGIQPVPLVAVVAGEEESIPAAAGAWFKVYPNPTTGSFTLDFSDKHPSGRTDVVIYNMRGERLATYELNGERSHVFSLTGRSAGLYLINVAAGTRSETVRILKE
ncbi:MAG: T9SS type A sorting domain-containing protein [Bacteroidetes bacterium]|nr:T9SS type A sorting domain-containing protein [Bacteroidota bacterium]